MAISTDAVILFSGTQDEVTTGTPGTVASGAFSVAGDTADWTNDDDAPLAGAVIKCQFDTTFPTAGSIGLYCRMMNIQSTNDEPADSDSYHFLGSFKIPYGATADVDFYAAIPLFEIPWLVTSQVLHFHIKNEGTGQTIGTGWQLWITPLTHGPHP